MLLWVIFGLFLAIWEQTIRTFLYPPFTTLFPVMPVAVFAIIRGRRYEIFGFLLTAGIIGDLFPFSDVHAALFALGFLFFVLVSVADNIMTNHSVYSAIVLVGVARIIVFLFELPFHLIAEKISAIKSLTFSHMWPIFVWDIALCILLFGSEFVFKRFFVRSRSIRPMYGK